MTPGREAALIAKIGRNDLGLGPLCNLTDGGEGVPKLHAAGVEKQKVGSALGRLRRAEWAKNNPDALREMGRRLGQFSVEWVKNNPELAAVRSSAAGKIGGVVTQNKRRSDPILAEKQKQIASENLQKWMKENPGAAANNPARKDAVRKWQIANPDRMRENGRRVGALRRDSWSKDPEGHRALLRMAAEGRGRLAKERPDVMRQLASHAGSFNKIKAASRARCLALIAEHRLEITPPSGRAGIKPWQEFEERLIALVGQKAAGLHA